MAIGDLVNVTSTDGSTAYFRVDSSGNVTCSGTIASTGVDDFGSNGIKSDIVAESTSAAGVTVDGCLIKDGRAALLATAGMFTSTIQTGTGSAQNIAHGFGAVPSMVWWSIADAGAGLGAGPPPVLSFAPGTHTTTNVVMTVSNGVTYYVFALK